MCEPDATGVSRKFPSGPTFCFLFANDTVVQQPLHIENVTAALTSHAVGFVSSGDARPWYYLLSFLHVHTPLFTMRQNRGRSAGGAFGDNVEEMDDAVGAVMAAVERRGARNSTLVFLTSDNGPYQEEGWAHAGRTNVYVNGTLVGRLRGGKGQVFEGGIRVPGIVSWPTVIRGGAVSAALVSTFDIFPTVLRVAGVAMPPSYVIDGVDMSPVLADPEGAPSQHDVLLHYCGFTPLAATVRGRWKVFWGEQKWYTDDPANYTICTQCCNGIVPASRLFAPATDLCGCEEKDIVARTPPIVYDLREDVFEANALTEGTWPAAAGVGYADVVGAANATRAAMEAAVHPTPDPQGAGTCTAGFPAAARQPCCPGCEKTALSKTCVASEVEGAACECDALPAAVVV